MDVAADLPKKNEQVLFCRLTGVQRELYKKFLKGEEVKSILEGTRHALYGIDILRKICNHPDLLERKAHQFVSIWGFNGITRIDCLLGRPSDLVAFVGRQVRQSI